MRATRFTAVALVSEQLLKGHIMSSSSESEKLQQWLNRQAKTHKDLKQGSFAVTRDDAMTIVRWSTDQRVEQFLVKEPVTPQELKGTVSDVFFRLKRRLERPATATSSNPVA
jgi:hypothetical protein